MFNLVIEIIIALVMEVHLFIAVMAFRDIRHNPTKDRASVRINLTKAIGFMLMLSPSPQILILGLVVIGLSLLTRKHYQKILSNN